MQKFKVSIIIPVYNTEIYLRRCLNSCINQTLDEIEIIVINDASPDKSYIIMQEYEIKYPEKVKCIYLQDSVCPGGARNFGLQTMQGEYFYFLDSDDYMEANLCECMYKKAVESNSDMVFCDHYAEMADKTVSKIINFSQEKMRKEYLQLLILDASPCGKLFHHELLKRHNIYYPENMFYEDTAITPVWTMMAQSYAKVNNALWTYSWCGSSITRSKSSQSNDLQRIKAVEIFYNNCNKVKINGKFKCEIEIYALSRIIDSIISIARKFDYLECASILKIKNAIIKLAPEYKTNPLLTYVFFPYERRILNDIMEEKLKETILSDEFNHKYVHNKTDEIELYFEEHKDYIKNMMVAFKEKGYEEITLWGMGVIGKALYYSITSLGFKLVAVDNSSKVYNTKLMDGNIIQSAQNQKGKNKVILITNQRYYDHVNTHSAGAKIIDVMSCLKLKQNIKSILEE